MGGTTASVLGTLASVPSPAFSSRDKEAIIVDISVSSRLCSSSISCCNFSYERNGVCLSGLLLVSLGHTMVDFSQGSSSIDLNNGFRDQLGNVVRRSFPRFQ